jgi:flagellar basal-body rod modification protein FlgD
MISKMSNQDPLDPTDDTEFLSQLAQYTSLEQMMNMSEAMTRQQGFDMVGKYVIISNNGSYYTGRVDSVIYDSGEISLDVGGVVVSMDAVKEILAEAYTSTDTDISENTAEAE